MIGKAWSHSCRCLLKMIRPVPLSAGDECCRRCQALPAIGIDSPKRPTTPTMPRRILPQLHYRSETAKIRLIISLFPAALHVGALSPEGMPLTMKSSFLGKRCLHQHRADISPRAGPPRRSTPVPIQAAADLNQGLLHGKQHQRSKAGTAAAVATDKDKTWAPGQHSSLGQQVGCIQHVKNMVKWSCQIIAALKSLLMLQPVNGNGKHKKFIGKPLSNR